MFTLRIAGAFCLALAAAAVTAQQARIVTVTTETQTNRVTLGGVVVPYKTVRTVALTGGRVTYVVGEVGTVVHAGQPCVAIDDTREAAALSQAQAHLASAMADWRSAFAAYQKEIFSPAVNDVTGPGSLGPSGLFNMFFTRPFASAAGIENPRLMRWATQVASYQRTLAAGQQVRAAADELTKARSALYDTRAYAPFNAVIIGKQVEIGDTVQPGTPLMTLAFVGRMRVKVDVPERLVSVLQLGQTLPVIVEGGRVSIPAAVAEIYPLADPSTHTVTVKLDLAPGAPVASGMYASVSLPEAGPLSGAEVVIPEEALISGNYLPTVLALPAGAQQSQLRVLRLGESLPNGRVVVLAGLRPGERIVLNPPPQAPAGWMPPAAKPAGGNASNSDDHSREGGAPAHD
ncbi:MAG: efflux RND transporter periplasmic adaptor subunit [Gammaproteobacteria bacterium]|jgi:multidrug efflux pump subunit AcrA (membrane-fusion protein)